MKTHSELLEKVESFQNMLISYATGGAVDKDEFKRLRDELLNEPLVSQRKIASARSHTQRFQTVLGFHQAAELHPPVRERVAATRPCGAKYLEDP